MKTANKYGAKTPFIRPENLSSDTASSAEALQHAVYFMEDLHNKRYDYIVELMCTNPLKTVSDIDAIIKDIKTSKADLLSSNVKSCLFLSLSKNCFIIFSLKLRSKYSKKSLN